MKLKWSKHRHPLANVPVKMSGLYFPEYQWVAGGGEFSIIYPIGYAPQKKLYELYDGVSIYRFETLKEAKAYALKLTHDQKKNCRN